MESLSNLLTTIGKVLDASSRLHVDQYFIHLNNFKVDERIGIRICFMLKDVVDLRGTRWIPRRDVLVQKTLAETRKDAEKDQAPKNTGGRGGGGHRGPRNDLPSRGSRNTQGGGFRGGDGQSNHYQRQQGRDGGHGGQRQTLLQQRGSMSKNKPSKSLPARPSLKKSKSAGKIVAVLENVPAKVKTVVRQSLQEFVRLKDVNEVVAALKEMKEVEVDILGYVVAVEGLVWAAEAKSADADAIMTIVLALVKEGTVVHWKHLQYAFCILVKTGPDAKVDVPLFGSNMATFLGRMLNVKDAPLTLTWLLTGCGEGEGSESPHDWPTIAWSEFVTSGLLAEVTGRILSTSPELVTCLQKDHAPLTLLFDKSSSLGKELDAWMTKYALQPLLGLQKAVHVVGLLNTLHDWDAIVSWIDQELTDSERKSSFFALHVCLLTLSLSNRPEHIHCDLIGGFSGGLSEEACIQGIAWCQTPVVDFGILNMFIKEGVISKLAWKKWRETTAIGSTASLNVLMEFADQL